MKDLVKKAEIHEKYKIHRNLLSALIKESKLKYFNKYIQNNLNNNNCNLFMYNVVKWPNIL